MVGGYLRESEGDDGKDGRECNGNGNNCCD